MPTRTVETFGNRVQLESTKPELSVFENGVVKDGFAVSLGDVLGKITSGGKLRRRPVSVVGATPFATNSAAGSVADGTLFKAGDVLKAYAPIKQVETASVVGTIAHTGAGNATVIVTSGLMSSSPKTYSVAVANDDTASLVAGKIRAALGAAGELADFYDVSGSGANVVLTAKVEAANDASLNISIDNGTCSGLTTEATSTNTTPGRASLTTVGTIDSISGNNITLTGNAAIVVLTGAVISASDGSQVAVGIANGGNDGTGDTNFSVCIGGYLTEAKLNGLDSTAKTELVGRSTPGGTFRF